MLLPEGQKKAWNLVEIQDRFQLAIGLKPGKKTILRRNTQIFKQYGHSPLRRVGDEMYTLDLAYYSAVGDKVRAPGQQGRPRKYPYDDPVDRRHASAKRPEYRRYQRWYKRLTRKPEETVLGEFFSGNETFDAPTVQRMLYQETSVEFGDEAVSSFLRHYVQKARGPPFIEEVEPGVYRKIRN